MRTLNDYGDEETRWDPTIGSQVTTVRTLFDKHIKNGGMAFEVPRDSREHAEIVRKFNPRANEIILAPRMVGG